MTPPVECAILGDLMSKLTDDFIQQTASEDERLASQLENLHNDD